MKRCFSLKRNKDFGYVYRSGKSVACRTLVLIYRKNRTGLLHVGLSVSKKIGNSVTRNRVKRRLRAALCEYIPKLDKNFDVIIIARRSVTDCSFGEIGDALAYAFGKAGLMGDNSAKTAESSGE